MKLCKVGSVAAETGDYRHSACTHTIYVYRGDRLPACQKVRSCPNRGADWVFIATTTLPESPQR